jgi:hypothetical protein
MGETLSRVMQIRKKKLENFSSAASES